MALKEDYLRLQQHMADCGGQLCVKHGVGVYFCTFSRDRAINAGCALCHFVYEAFETQAMYFGMSRKRAAVRVRGGL